MRRFLIFLAVLVGGAAFAAGVPAAVADSNAVQVVPCRGTVFTITEGGFTFTYCFTDVVTPSGNANAHFHGSLVDPTTAPSRATKVSGFLCTAGYPHGDNTTDSRLVVTPDGTVNGICKFHHHHQH
jgi:hypothetical protein